MKYCLKIFLALLLIYVLLGLLMTFAAGAEPTPQPQCVKVRVDDGRGNGSLGSGAYIGPALVATCWHVTQDRVADDSITIMFPVPVDYPLPEEGDDGLISYVTTQEWGWDEIPGTLLAEDKKQELVFIELSRLPACKPLALSSWPLEAGTRLSTQGYGDGRYKRSWGPLVATPFSNGWREILAESFSGDSGGPIIDTEDRFVGTLWGSNGKTTTFTPIEIIKRHIADLNIKIPDPEVKPPDDDYRIYGASYHQRTQEWPTEKK